MTASLPPSPRGPGLWSLVRWYRDPIGYLEHCRDTLGPAFTLRWPHFGAHAFFHEPAALKQIFTAPPDVARGGEGNAFLGALMGETSVLVIDGPGHQRKRRLLAPALSAERTLRYVPAIEALTLDALDALPRRRAIPLRPALQDLTLRVILRTVFGAERDDELDELMSALRDILEMAANPALYAPPLRIDLGPRSPWGAFLARRARVDRVLHALIARRRRSPEESPGSVLSLLLGARADDGSEASDDEVRDELVTLLVTGHETTATSAAWLIERALRHPNVCARLRDELREVVGEAPLTGEALARMPYLDATVRESLRVRPVFSYVGRKLHAPVQVDRWLLPAGTTAVACIALAHSDPARWPSPEVFDPARFLAQKPEPYTWIPFGGGARRCVGMSLALVELQVLLAIVTRRRDLSLASTQPSRVARRGMTLAPADDTLVTRA